MDLSRFQTQAGGSVGAMLGTGGGPASTAPWSPANPLERQYYDHLFGIADVQRAGFLAGQPAVAFFMKSRLEMAVLKQVWDVAVSGKVHQLGPEEFYVAMRLIAMAQGMPGQPISLERLVAEGSQAIPIARFENCPPPPHGLQFSQGLGGAPAGMAGGPGGQDPYAMTPSERAKYESLFGQYDKDGDGFVTGQEAVALFTLSGMSRQDLRMVWELSDADHDSKLNRHEFNVAMHLIVCVSKKGMVFPATLPPSLMPGGGGGGAGMPAPSPDLKSPTAPKPMTPAPPPANRGDLIADAFGDLNPEETTSSAPAPSGPPPSPGGGGAMGTPGPPVTHSPMPQQGGSAGFGSGGGGGGSSGIPMSMGGGPGSGQMPQYGQPPYGQPPQQPPQLQHMRSGSLGNIGGAPAGDGRHGRSASSGSVGGGEQMSGDLVNDLNTAGDDLIGVTRQAAGQYSQAMAAQRGSVDSLRKLVQKMQQEKVSLAAILQGSQDEYMENKKLLEEMGGELEQMTAELHRLRQQRQEEEAAVAELRQQVMVAQSRRAGLLTDIGATTAAINGLQAEKNMLVEGVARSETTRTALDGYSRSLEDVTGQHVGDMRQMNNHVQQHQQQQPPIPSPKPQLQLQQQPAASSPRLPPLPSSGSALDDMEPTPPSPSSSSLPPVPPQPPMSSPYAPPPPPPKPSAAKPLPSLPPTPAAAVPPADDPFADVQSGGGMGGGDAFATASFANGGGEGGGGGDGFGAFDAAEDPFSAAAFTSAGDPFAEASAAPAVDPNKAAPVDGFGDGGFGAFGVATADPFATDGGFNAFPSSGGADPF